MSNKTDTLDRGGHSIASLGEKKFAPLRYYVQDMVVEGLTLLAGRPKKGKSWMVLSMGLDIAEGQPTLGELETRAANVVYYALEDNERRMQRRVTTLLGPDTSNWPEDMHVYYALNRIDDGGLEQIRADVRKHKAKVVFIDTLTAIRPRPVKGLDPYQQDYDAAAMLHALAHELRIAIVMVYHTKKAITEDAQDSIMGSTGLVGAVDSWFVLRTSADKKELIGAGRDIEPVEWIVKHGLRAKWTILGSADEVGISEERRRVMRVLRDAGGELPVSIIHKRVGGDYDNLKVLLSNMFKADDIARPRHGVYAYIQK